jgi:glutaredoxin 3
MPRVEIYISPWCPFCARAKALLEKKCVAYEVIDVDADSAAREVMIARAQGRRTVPQIFIDDRHVGGSDDLAALDRQGKLDTMLGITP